MNTIEYFTSRNTTRTEEHANTSFEALQKRARRCSVTNELPLLVRNSNGEFAKYENGECTMASRAEWLG